jgi:DNA polymerase I-like protein with 3'-5' exonuclease and polymerase domains
MERFSNNIEVLPANANNPILRQRFTTNQFSDGLSDTQKRINLILKEMEEGFQVDVHTLTNLKRSYESTLFSLKEEIQEKLGRAIRLNSNEELGDLLFTNLGLPSLRGTHLSLSMFWRGFVILTPMYIRFLIR